MTTCLLPCLLDLARGAGVPPAFLPGDGPYIAGDTAARTLPVCHLLPATAALATDQTRPFVDLLIQHHLQLHWQQSYGPEDGFSQDWLDAYGWVNLMAPDGLYYSETHRISVGYWGAGQDYPDHAHEPEEIYLILAGGALFRAEGHPTRRVSPSALIHHAPWQRHGMAMQDTPLLAAALWRGNNLLTKSRLARSNPGEF